ncbi:uncharacterized protein N0V89_002325 [Didymosphaeria variabile]|uniref:Uncharacterized protein n=1 Tax=Didymosphaeria variabile TaxID=1932322 RepID=A0A9W8XSJ3_9PLEO|nr:uncharacterized protein N0V89_002325 [Didymosphaeria variabile]KAJ4357749.1 hypothetical protein N0V89_002325 [Didymosphaeria variabile]
MPFIDVNRGFQGYAGITLETSPDSGRLLQTFRGATVLQAERSASALVIDKLSEHLLSRDDFLKRQGILKVLRKEKLFDKEQQSDLSRPGRYPKQSSGWVRRDGWDHEDHKMADYLDDEISPFHLHMTMFRTQAQLEVELNAV